MLQENLTTGLAASATSAPNEGRNAAPITVRLRRHEDDDVVATPASVKTGGHASPSRAGAEDERRHRRAHHRRRQDGANTPDFGSTHCRSGSGHAVVVRECRRENAISQADLRR
jgi:hypothetical protein